MQIPTTLLLAGTLAFPGSSLVLGDFIAEADGLRGGSDLTEENNSSLDDSVSASNSVTHVSARLDEPLFPAFTRSGSASAFSSLATLRARARSESLLHGQLNQAQFDSQARSSARVENHIFSFAGYSSSETFTLTIYTVVSDFASVEVPNPGQSPDRNRVNVSFGDRWVQINENNLEVSGTAQGSEYSMRVNGDKTSSGAGSRVKEMVFTNLNETSRIKRTAGVAVETSSLGNSVGETYSVYGSITVNTYFCIEDGGVKYLAPQGLSSLQTSDSLSAEEQPRIAGFQRSGDTLKFIWTGAIGKTFRFESTIDFESWEPIEGSQVTLASPIGFTELPYLGGSAIIRLAEVTET